MLYFLYTQCLTQLTTSLKKLMCRFGFQKNTSAPSRIKFPVVDFLKQNMSNENVTIFGKTIVVCLLFNPDNF